MALTITLDELLIWSDEERAKWSPWFHANSAALDVVMQEGGRFSTIGALVDHIFLIERRHTLRLQGVKELPTQTGVVAKDVDGLWRYAEESRQGLRAFLPTLALADANTPRDVVVATGTYPLSPRKLLFHMVLHEVRHWAQIAAVARGAGFTPPGDHDLFYSKALV